MKRIQGIPYSIVQDLDDAGEVLEGVGSVDEAWGSQSPPYWMRDRHVTSS